MTWLTLKAWPWLKKYWKWLLFPLGIIIFILGYSARRPVKVTSSELLGHAEEEKKFDAKAKRELEEAEAEKDKKLADIEKEHGVTIAKLRKDQRAKVKELRDNPDELNSFLLNVGKEIRGE